MNVWIRISGRLRTESDIDAEYAANLSVSCDLNVDIYPTSSLARAAQTGTGGIVFELDAAQLSEAQNYLGQDVLLIGADEEERGQTPRTGTFTVCCGRAPNLDDHLELGGEAETWLRQFESVTGLRIHQ